MMTGFNWVHKPYIVEVRMHFKEVFAQVLRSLQILQVSRDIVTGYEVLTLRLVAMISQNHDFVDLENTCDARYLTDEVSSQR